MWLDGVVIIKNILTKTLINRYRFIKLKIHILISSIQEQRLKCESFFKHVYKQEQRKHVYNRAMQQNSTVRAVNNFK